MKLAYVSFVIQNPSSIDTKKLTELDKTLSEACQSYEIIIVLPFGNYDNFDVLKNGSLLKGPLSFVLTNESEAGHNSVNAGLGRAVGDFVIDWYGDLEVLDFDVISKLLKPSDHGVELVEILSPFKSKLTRLYFRILNQFRSTSFPINNSIGYVFSRRTLQLFLGASIIEKYSELILASLPVKREIMYLPAKLSTQQVNLRKSFAFITRGTNFGINFPIFLSIIFGSFTIFASIYAISVFVFRGRTPEGWVTIMVVLGLSQAIVLLLLGMLWNQLKNLTDTLFKGRDTTVDVKIYSPSNPIQLFNNNSTDDTK